MKRNGLSYERSTLVAILAIIRTLLLLIDPIFEKVRSCIERNLNL